MIQVPWLALMPRPPAMVGTDTLAMVMSSTAMKLALASRTAASHSLAPCSGASMVSCADMTLHSIDLVGVDLADVDRRGHRQADAQRMRRDLVARERDAHRDALHDLDP